MDDHTCNASILHALATNAILDDGNHVCIRETSRPFNHCHLTIDNYLAGRVTCLALRRRDKHIRSDVRQQEMHAEGLASAAVLWWPARVAAIVLIEVIPSPHAAV